MNIQSFEQMSSACKDDLVWWEMYDLGALNLHLNWKLNIHIILLISEYVIKAIISENLILNKA